MQKQSLHARRRVRRKLRLPTRAETLFDSIFAPGPAAAATQQQQQMVQLVNDDDETQQDQQQLTHIKPGAAIDDEQPISINNSISIVVAANETTYNLSVVCYNNIVINCI